MAGAQHRRERLFAGRAIGLRGRERADPAALGEAQRRRPGAVGRDLARLGRILVADAGGAQRRVEPAARHSRGGTSAAARAAAKARSST